MAQELAFVELGYCILWLMWFLPHVASRFAVNGQLLQHQTNNYWSWNPTSGPINPQGPFDFALLGQNRQVLRVRLPQLRSIDLGIQFSATSQAAAVPAPEGPAATATPPVATATGATTGSAAPTPSG